MVAQWNTCYHPEQEGQFRTTGTGNVFSLRKKFASFRVWSMFTLGALFLLVKSLIICRTLYYFFHQHPRLSARYCIISFNDNSLICMTLHYFFLQHQWLSSVKLSWYAAFCPSHPPLLSLALSISNYRRSSAGHRIISFINIKDYLQDIALCFTNTPLVCKILHYYFFWQHQWLSAVIYLPISLCLSFSSISLSSYNRYLKIFPCIFCFEVQYLKLRALQRQSYTHYFYEATVGAGLPIISTLQGLLETGDKILRIEGIFRLVILRKNFLFEWAIFSVTGFRSLLSI